MPFCKEAGLIYCSGSIFTEAYFSDGVNYYYQDSNKHTFYGPEENKIPQEILDLLFIRIENSYFLNYIKDIT